MKKFMERTSWLADMSDFILPFSIFCFLFVKGIYDENFVAFLNSSSHEPVTGERFYCFVLGIMACLLIISILNFFVYLVDVIHGFVMKRKGCTKVEYRCHECSIRVSCPAANTGVCYPCPHFENCTTLEDTAE